MIGTLTPLDDQPIWSHGADCRLVMIGFFEGLPGELEEAALVRWRDDLAGLPARRDAVGADRALRWQ